MRLHSDGRLSLSPSDLSSHLACPHLTTLSLAAARGEIVKPKLDSPHRELIFRKGNEHEAAYLARLEGEGRSIVRIPTYDDEGFDADEAQRLTEEAIRAGVGRGDLPAVSRPTGPGAASRTSSSFSPTAGTSPSTRSSRARRSRRTCCS